MRSALALVPGTLLVLAACSSDESAPAGPNLPPGIAATVNGIEITESALAERIDAVIQARMPTAGAMPPQQLEPFRAQMRPQILDEMVSETLLDSEVERAGIVVTDDEFRTRIEGTVESLLSARQITRDEYAEEITSQTGKTLEQFMQDSAADPNYRRTIRHLQFIASVYPDVSAVSDEDVATRFETEVEQFSTPERVRASHVLIGTTPATTDEERAAAQQKAADIAQQAQQPDADFAALAREHSTCSSGPNGGDLGAFPRTGAMVEPFAAAAFELDVGQVSDVVETQFGYHVIKVTEREEGHVPMLADVSAALRDMIKFERFLAKRSEHVQTLRASATIESALTTP